MSNDSQVAGDIPKILTCDDDVRIAFHQLAGKTPGVVFLTGFMSDMSGGKALALEEMCRADGRAFLRFDYQGHGASSGEFADGTIGVWAGDALAALDRLTEGPQILVGSSMGGWIMLLVARARPDRVAGLVGIAAAPDFTERFYNDGLTDAQRDEMARTGRVVIPSDYEDDYTFTKDLIEDGRAQCLLEGPIAIDCPVRLLQGMRDDAVPWQTALSIQDKLRSDDVEVALVKDGDHRLSEPHDIERLLATVRGLAAKTD